MSLNSSLPVFIESTYTGTGTSSFALPVFVTGGNVVGQLVAGPGITLSPTGGVGVVTVSAQGVGGGVNEIVDHSGNVATGNVNIVSADGNLTVVNTPGTNGTVTLTNAAPCNATTAIVPALSAPQSIVYTPLSSTSNPGLLIETSGTNQGPVLQLSGNGGSYPTLSLTNQTSAGAFASPIINVKVQDSTNPTTATHNLAVVFQPDTQGNSLTVPAGGGTLISTTNYSLTGGAGLASNNSFTATNQFITPATGPNAGIPIYASSSAQNVPALELSNGYRNMYNQSPLITMLTSEGAAQSTFPGTLNIIPPIEPANAVYNLTLPAGSGTLISTANIAANLPSSVIQNTSTSGQSITTTGSVAALTLAAPGGTVPSLALTDAGSGYATMTLQNGTNTLTVGPSVDTTNRTLALPPGGGTVVSTANIATTAIVPALSAPQSIVYTPLSSTSNPGLLIETSGTNQGPVLQLSGNGGSYPTLSLTNQTSAGAFASPIINVKVQDSTNPTTATHNLAVVFQPDTQGNSLTVPAGGGTLISTTNMASYMPTQIIAGTGVTVSPTTGIGAVTVTATGTAGVSEVLAGTGITVNANTGNVTVTNNGVTAITPSTGISATGTNNITLTNTGVTSLAAGSGMTVSNNTGAVTVTNNGLVSATGGTGINVTTTGTNANITNTGVTSITAGTDITVSGNTGAVTVGLNTGNIVTSIAANSPLTVNANTGAVTMSLNTSNVVTAVNAGTGISVNQNTGSVTVTNNGVTGITAGTGIATTGSGNVTVTNNGVTQINAGTGISVSSGTGSVTITNTSGGYTLDNSSTPITSSSSDTHVPSSKNVANSCALIAANNAFTGSLNSFAGINQLIFNTGAPYLFSTAPNLIPSGSYTWHIVDSTTVAVSGGVGQTFFACIAPTAVPCSIALRIFAHYYVGALGWMDAEWVYSLRWTSTSAVTAFLSTTYFNSYGNTNVIPLFNTTSYPGQAIGYIENLGTTALTNGKVRIEMII